MSINSAGTVWLDLKLDSKGFNKQMGGMNKLAAKAGAALAAAFSVKAVVTFGKQCLELGSDLAEVQNVVDTVFPNMSEQVNKFAQNAAASFGLSETMAKKYTGTFGAMADAFGFAENESYAMATALTGLAGDVASFYNITQDEAYTKLKSVFTGETESLKELGVVMTQSALDQYALANGYGKTTSAMTEQEKVALRYAFVQNQLSNAAGDFAKTSGSWANQVRYLTLQMQSFKAAIGQGLINILTPVIQWLNTLMSKLVAAANAFKKFTETLTGKKSQPVSLKNASEGVGAVADSADNANSALNKTKKNVQKLKRELAGFDQINKLGDPSSDSGSSATGGSSGSVGGIDTAVDTTAETGKVEKLTQKYKKLGKAVDKLKKSFKGFTNVVGKGLKWAYKNVLKPLGEWTIKKYLPADIERCAGAYELLTAVLETLAPVFRILWDIVKPVFKLFGNAIITNVKSLGDSFRTLANILQKYAVPFTEKLYEGWKKLKESVPELLNSIGEIPTKVKEWFAEEIKLKISAWFSDKREDLKEKWTNLTADIKDKTAEMRANIAQKWEDLKKNWEAITNNIQGKTVSFAAKITATKDAIKKAWQKIADEWQNKVAKFSLKFSASAADLKAWVNKNVIDKINAKFKKVPILKEHTIPHLAQGGYVKKNTPQLAMIGDNRHQGEVVAPERKLEEMALRAASMAGGGVTPELIEILKEILAVLNALDLNVYLDGKLLKKRIVDLINTNTKATGVCEIIV
jgi:phage-related protein